jgi:hypothetical protein
MRIVAAINQISVDRRDVANARANVIDCGYDCGCGGVDDSGDGVNDHAATRFVIDCAWAIVVDCAVALV